MNKPVAGLLLVDKPAAMTSHDVIAVLRGKLRMKQIGHAGTLDPQATGLLPVLVGAATKQAARFLAFDKAYAVEMTLGITTETADCCGAVRASRPVPAYSEGEVAEYLRSFCGAIEQIPPMYSAKKIGGKKLYELARSGVVVERPARTVVIKRLEITRIALPRVWFTVECSKGTYIRTLCEDIGVRMGCGAHLSGLRRLSCGPFSLEQAIPLAAIRSMPLETLHSRIMAVAL
ncbi:MAG: tRNA pseudouridine(55) synthase TruB [Candidatus Omnitrophica bacterium]|nr:tRNA pseudouridine(55) synthase TruB [Candidatus Omnitrophota bacterium]